MRPGHVILAATVLMAAALSACGGGEESDLGGRPAPQAPSANQNQVRPTPRDKVQDGGTFTYPIDSMPPNFNRHELDGTDVNNSYVMGALMPSTFDTDATGTPVWNRGLLAAEPTLKTEPKQVVTYRINPKAVWYDGTPITWEDFYWQWKASNGTDKAYQIASSNGYSQVESVQKGADDREVVVTFSSPYADWQAIFSELFPVSTNKDAKVFNEGWRNKPLTTAGPFKLDSLDVTSKTITLVRNEKWWGEPAKMERIVFRVIEPDAQIDALANGEIDAIDVGPDANKYNRAKTIEGAEVRTAGGPNFRHLTINGTSTNLQDVRVRRALAMAIDRAAIARAMLGPLGIQAVPLDNHIFMANQKGYQSNSGEVGTYNPERAKQLLDEAGWKLEGTVRKKDGKLLEVNAVIPAAVATSKQETELMQNMVAQVGITMRINVVPSPDFFANYITPGQFDVTVFSWIGTAFPMSSARSLYAMPTKNAAGELDIQQNYARIGSAAIDDLFIKTTGELNREKATESANQIDALIWDEVHSLTLYQRPELVVAKRKLVNFGAFGFASWSYENIGWEQ